MPDKTERSQELGSNPKTQSVEEAVRELKHTPKPWKVVSGEFKEGGLIAYELEFPESSRACISMADAHLIEAAPEMYEALKAVATDDGLLDVIAGEGDPPFMKLVKAALAKAEGRSL